MPDTRLPDLVASPPVGCEGGVEQGSRFPKAIQTQQRLGAVVLDDGLKPHVGGAVGLDPRLSQNG